MAEAQKKTPEEVLLNILMAGNGRAIISLATISEANIKTEMAHSLSIVSSNGVGYAKDHAKTGEMTHPRNFGAMPRFLGTFVREQHVLRWEEAIHKLTGAPAQRLGLMDRGHIMRGQRADVVIFHPEEIESMATFARPYRFPRGIRSVIVNGELTVSEGVSTEARAGQVIRRHQSWWSRILQSRIV
jgi:N-acyl-D-amino-acid deacylase